MKSNPGGQLSPDQIVGRDELITRMWGILEGRSIYMNDVRRVGKTQIMVKMHSSPPAGWISIKCDLGGIHSAAEFATQAYRMSEQALGSKKKVLRSMEKLLQSAAGMTIGSVVKLPDGNPAPWKEVLRRTFADVNEAMVSMGSTDRMVFLWDEVPFLLDNISKRERSETAMEVLDALRSLGQDHDRIRFVLTGSIGLHHILHQFHQEGYNNSPLNRMELVQPGPLATCDANQLALDLLEGEGIRCDDPDTTARTVASSVGNVSFYIHKLISRLPKQNTVNASDIDAILRREITSDNNDWDLQHYRSRLKPYYGTNETLALWILDHVAVSKPATFAAIRSAVNSQSPVDGEQLRKLLALLCRDHYLRRDSENTYTFYLGLLQQWWCLSRNLP